MILLQRSCQIIFQMGYHFTKLLIARLGLLLSGRSQATQGLYGLFWADLFESLGPSFLKIGQILSTRADVLPPEVISSLKRLQDQVRPIGPRAVQRQLQKNYGKNWQELFQAFDPLPVASGSIAQVHRALLAKDGREAAIKIRRPGIGRMIRADLRLIRVLARGISRLPTFRNMPLEGLFDQIGTVLLRQLDFQLEAAHNLAFAEMFRSNPSILLPEVYPEFSTNQVMVMKYLPDLERFDSPDIPLDTFKSAAKIAIHCIYSMVFYKGLIHCDLHPANLCLQLPERVVLLDTGFVAT